MDELRWPQAFKYEWRGVDEGWVVMFDLTFTGYQSRSGLLPVVESWCKENASMQHKVYWSGEIAFASEDDAMLCLLRFS